MKRFVSALTVSLIMAAMLAASAVPALASPLGGVSLATCSYWHGTVIVVDGEFVCKRADVYSQGLYAQ